MWISILIFIVSLPQFMTKAQLEATVGLQYNAQFTLHCSFMFILKLTAKTGSVIQPDAS